MITYEQALTTQNLRELFMEDDDISPRRFSFTISNVDGSRHKLRRLVIAVFDIVTRHSARNVGVHFTNHNDYNQITLGTSIFGQNIWPYCFTPELIKDIYNESRELSTWLIDSEGQQHCFDLDGELNIITRGMSAGE